MRNNEFQLRRDIVRFGRLMYESGLICAGDGNLSARLDGDRILVTASGFHKGFLETEQILIVDGRGRIVGSRAAGGQRLKASSELPMHLEAYRLRPDIQAIVHAHPPITVALSIAGISVERCLLPETIVSLGLIPTASYATPASEENVSAIRDLIVDHDAIVLERHGSLTVGDSLQQAFMRLESVEQNARIAFMLAQLGVDNPLEPAQVGKLLQQRKDLGLSHAGDETRFCRQCGLPLEAQCGHEETAVESQQLRELVTKIVTKNLKVD